MSATEDKEGSGMANDKQKAKKAIKKQVKKLVRAVGAEESLKLVNGLVEANVTAEPAKAKRTKAEKAEAAPAKPRKAKAAAASA